MTKKQFTISVIISYITLAISVILACFYTPFVLKKLGDIEYGVRSFATSLAGYLSFLSIGMNTAYLRFANIAKKENGEKGIAKINGIFLTIFIVVGAIALVVGSIMVISMLTGIIPLKQYSDHKDLIIAITSITIADIVISFPVIVFKLFAQYKEKFVFLRLVELIITILNPLLCIMVLSFGYRSLAMTWVSFGIGIFSFILHLSFALFFLKGKFDLKLTKNDKKTFSDIIKFSIFVFIVSSLTQLNTIVDKVVIGFMMTPNDVTIYTLSIVFISYLNSMVVAITGLFVPRLTFFAVNQEYSNLSKTYDSIIKAICIILSMIVFGFAACGKEFIGAWVGNEYDIYWYSFVSLACQIIIVGQSPSFTIQRGLNKNKIPALIYGIVFLLNVILSIVLCRFIGIWGCIIGTIFSCIVEAISISIYNCKAIKLPQKQFWISIIINSIIGLFSWGAVFTFYKLVKLETLTWFIQFIIKGFSFMIIFCLAQFLLNKKAIKGFASEFKNRKKVQNEQ